MRFLRLKPDSTISSFISICFMQGESWTPSIFTIVNMHSHNIGARCRSILLKGMAKNPRIQGLYLRINSVSRLKRSGLVC